MKEEIIDTVVPLSKVKKVSPEQDILMIKLTVTIGDKERYQIQV